MRGINSLWIDLQWKATFGVLFVPLREPRSAAIGMICLPSLVFMANKARVDKTLAPASLLPEATTVQDQASPKSSWCPNLWRLTRCAATKASDDAIAGGSATEACHVHEMPHFVGGSL